MPFLLLPTALICGLLAAPTYAFDDGDGLRSAVVSVGDVDGDGVADFAMAHRPRPIGSGESFSSSWPRFQQLPFVWVLSGANGKVLQVFAGSEGFGTEMVATGDLDADGVCDLLVSDGRERESKNIVSVLSVGTGHVLAEFKTPQGVKQFGRGLAGGVQVIGDETPDLLIGAEGGAWLVDGATLKPAAAFAPGANCEMKRVEGPSWVLPKISRSEAPPQFDSKYRYPTSNPEPAFNVALLPDLDGDRLGEIVLSGPLDTACDVIAGKDGLTTGYVTRVLFSDPNSRQLNLDSEGWCLIGGRDLDGDGIGDIVTTTVNRRVQAWSTAKRSRLWQLGFDGGYLHAEGTSLDFAGDMDGDGLCDVLMAANETYFDADSGDLTLFSGTTRKTIRRWTVNLDQEPKPAGHLPGGLDACVIGDVNGDLIQEIAVQIPVLRRVRVLNGANLEVLWERDMDGLFDELEPGGVPK